MRIALFATACAAKKRPKRCSLTVSTLHVLMKPLNTEAETLLSAVGVLVADSGVAPD